MTHLSMPEQWSFRGVDLSTYAYLVARADGKRTLPDLRGEDFVVAGKPGRVFARKVHDSRRIPLAIYVLPDNAAGVRVLPTNLEQAQANFDALAAILTPRSQGALVQTMPDGSTRTAQAECVAGSEIEDAGGEIIGYLADFLLADPWFYGTDATVTQAIAASPTDFTFTNPGSVEGTRIVLDFTGPIVSPRVTQRTTGVYVECLVTVETGKHLLIDTAAWTATNDGVNAIASIRHSLAVPFLSLQPGANPLRVTAGTPGGSLTLTFSPGYL